MRNFTSAVCRLSSVEDDALGEELRVVWELEPGTSVLERAAMPVLTGFDDPLQLDAFLNAVRWGGEVVLIGFLTTDNPGIDYFHLKNSGATVRSIGVGDRGVRRVTQHLPGGRIQTGELPSASAFRQPADRPQNRPDPALDQIARLAGLGQAPGYDRH